MDSNTTNTILTVAASLLGALVGILVGHLLTKSREHESQRRTLRIQYLIQAYHSITNAVDREAVTREQVQAAEDAVIDIVLLGKREEIQAVETIQNTGNEEGFNLKPIMDALRKSLREELRLPTVEAKAVYLRWAPANLLPSKPLEVSVILATPIDGQHAQTDSVRTKSQSSEHPTGSGSGSLSGGTVPRPSAG
ncbi:hypothetical protein [Rathayibacter iranicus]|uniref:Uncharacterized protein n=2 Tax=Rathayibacter iranicus TaxID=59737 RepID=A0AAD1AD68_9MICO|nr:hypothetical protein [Rathayibacter iranicus]AZZ56226.1 hypothetical protein C7V51_10270 [Rathayibacter iranicus]MWV30068.1 hypothetical protein [Rathayibacter iranicus NCPPB 2253 = VKM Ac-1602]PPI46292.1 hypothetical protein C5E09_09255 [Rathayibacter iranicus]PPI59667.1 hypothetical protein C5E08_10180 [Rathayibacter iranicus]PPI71144.1 hypothetical protein C5E01_09220 [Rathayibacter iranicus]